MTGEAAGSAAVGAVDEADHVAANRFRGTVISVVADPVLAEVRLLSACGVLTAVLPRSEVVAQGMSVGATVELSFRSTKVALDRCLPGVPTCFHARLARS